MRWLWASIAYLVYGYGFWGFLWRRKGDYFEDESVPFQVLTTIFCLPIVVVMLSIGTGEWIWRLVGRGKR